MNVSKEKFSEACENIRDKITITDYLHKEGLSYDLRLEGEGMIRCPLPDHEDSTPSFSFDDKKGLFNCFGCHRGGDVVNLHYYMNKAENERYTRLKTVLELSKKYKITIPDLFNNEIKKGKVNKFKKVRTTKSNLTDDFFKEKVLGLGEHAKRLPVDKRIKVYRLMDDMFFGDIEPKDTFFKINKIMK